MASPRILIAWEMGGNYGHAAMISELARDLSSADIVIAARDISLVRQLVGEGPRIIEAPRAPDVTLPAGEQAVNYPDVLRQNGWGDVSGLTARISAWSALLDQVSPDVLVTEAAPTALLAARGRGLSTAIIGTGWSVPPHASPMPAFLHWEGIADDLLVERETAVLSFANTALKATGRAPLTAFCDLLEVDATLLTTLPEVDHYGPRDQFQADKPAFLGPLGTDAFGVETFWADRAAFRVLAYLRSSSHTFRPMLEALAALPLDTDVIVAAPGANPELTVQFADTPVRLIDKAVNFGSLLASCDLGVSHASHGMAATFAAAGVPQIGLPNHTEQVMVAHALWQNSLGLSHIGDADTETCAALIQAARDEPDLATAAANVAAREAARSKGLAADAIKALG